MSFSAFFFGAAFINNMIFGELCGSVFAAGLGGVKRAARVGAFTALLSVLTAAIIGLVSMFADVSDAFNVFITVVAVVLLSRAFYVLTKEDALPVALGAILVNMVGGSALGYGYDLLAVFLTAAAYFLTLLMMSGVHERIAYSKVPKALKGLPISLIVAGLMTLAFMGFTGLA